MPAFVQLVGGPKLGPFPGSFRIGSDPRRAQVVLDASGKVLPDHAVVTLYPNGVFGVEPAPGAGVWLAVQGQGQAWPIQSAVQVNPGDHLLLGSPGGSRLILLVEEEQARVPAARPSAAPSSWGPSIPGPRPGLGAAVGNEIVRQGTVRMLTRVGPIREAYYLMNRFRGGSLTNPTMLVSLLFAVGAAVAGGSLSCSGLLSLLWWKLTYH